MEYRVRARRAELDGKMYWQIEKLMGPRFIVTFDYTTKGRDQAEAQAAAWNAEDSAAETTL